MTAKYTECLCVCRTSESKSKIKFSFGSNFCTCTTIMCTHTRNQFNLRFNFINSHNTIILFSPSFQMHTRFIIYANAILMQSFFVVIQFHSFSTLFCRQQIFWKIIPLHFHVVVKYRTKNLCYCTLNHVRIFIWAQNICNLI